MLNLKRCSLFVFIYSLLMTFAYAQTDSLTQFSTIDALLSGVYDGQTDLAQVKQYGDFGLGTFNALDGEMVVLDGHIYQVPLDGKPVEPDVETTQTPFAVVTFFDVDNRMTLTSGIDYKTAETIIDRKLPTENIFYAVRIKGTFKKVTTRSVPKQQKPYPPLKEVVKHQAVFHLQDTRGTIIGFRSPSFVKGINVPGYHLHYLTDDRTAGGHVLDFTIEDAVLELDEITEFSLMIPRTKAFYELDVSEDTKSDLDKVERLHKKP